MRVIELLSYIGSRIGKPRGWERIVRLVAAPERFRGDADVRLERDGMTFIAQPSVLLSWYVCLFGTYEPELRTVFRSVVPQGGFAIDVGANIGWHTLLLAKLVGKTGTVLAVEANPSVRRRLEENLKANDLDQVRLLAFALSDREGTAAFYGPDEADGESGNGHLLTEAAGNPASAIRVKTRRLDDIIEADPPPRIDLIKVDVEGFEWPVFLGAEKTLARYRPHVTFEYIEDYAGRGGGTAQHLEDFFRKHRYELRALGRGGARPLLSGAWPRSADIWAVPLT